MKKVAIAIVLVLAMVAITPFSSVSANTDQSIKRGEFFQLLVDHLKYDGSNVKVELPLDVKTDSQFADTVRALKQKNIVVGFPDGTFKLNQEITTEEASAILSRVLAIKDDAKEKLSMFYGVDFANDKVLTSAKAKEAIQKALTSDGNAKEIMDKIAIAQNEQASYKATTEISMGMDMDLPVTDSPEVMDSMIMNGDLTMLFNKEKGMYQKMVTSVSGPIQQEITMEQYFVPEGIFMKITDPISGQDQWINMSAAMPFDFVELMKMNEESLKISQDLNNKYFIYKDLGIEQLDGKELQKIIFSGKIDSIEEILGMMDSMLGDQSMLTSLEGLPDMMMSMNGMIWVDTETYLPYRQLMDYEVEYGESKDPAMEMPIGKMNYSMDLIYSDYGKVNEIVLPAEALDAEMLPALNETQTQLDSNEE